MQSLIQIPKDSCPQCNRSLLLEDKENGELVCRTCGLVIQEEMINQGPEKITRIPEERDKLRRVGVPTRHSYFDKGLSTIIGGSKDSSGTPLSANTKRQMWRFRRWHIQSQIQHSHDRNLQKAMNELLLLSDKLQIPFSIREIASVLYRKILDRNLIKGRRIATLVAGALYVACRFTETPRTLNEIVLTSNQKRTDVSRAYRFIINKLNIKMPIHDPLKYISKIATKGVISEQSQNLAHRILQRAKRRRLTAGRDPIGIAASVLYIACQIRNENVTQKEVADAANTTEVSLRNIRNVLARKMDLKDFQSLTNRGFKMSEKHR
jgi:transcription initiation factor TFIIB